MINPFDRSFFKFFLGFIVIILASLAVLYFAGHYNASSDTKASIMQK